MQAGWVFDYALIAQSSEIGYERGQLTTFDARVDDRQTAGSAENSGETRRWHVVVDDDGPGNAYVTGLISGAVFNQLQRRT